MSRVFGGAGLEIDVASTIEDALVQLERPLPADCKRVVVTEYLVGHNTARRLVARCAELHIPCVILTSFPTRVDRELLRTARMLLVKPASFEEIADAFATA